MHNVNTETLNATIKKATQDPAAVKQPVAFDGEWQTTEGQPQFRASIPVPGADPFIFEADFPEPMGGAGSAPNPLAYCFWGGLACYAMTYAQEAATHGIELRSLRARTETEVDQSRALGITDNPPVERIDWTLHVDADATTEQLQELKQAADDHCPGVWCLTNPVTLGTHVHQIAEHSPL